MTDMWLAEDAYGRRIPWHFLYILACPARRHCIGGQAACDFNCVSNSCFHGEIDGPQILMLARGVGHHASLGTCFMHPAALPLRLRPRAGDEGIHERRGGFGELMFEQYGGQ